jgi:hypothetical protein
MSVSFLFGDVAAHSPFSHCVCSLLRERRQAHRIPLWPRSRSPVAASYPQQ